MNFLERFVLSNMIANMECKAFSNPSFTYCALRFLTQWQEEECKLHQALSNAPNKQNISAALNYFQVARTFSGDKAIKDKEEKREQALSNVLDCLQKVRQNYQSPQSLDQVNEQVTNLADLLKDYFSKRPISAASKLLWLTYQSPVVIYDRRAVKALKSHTPRGKKDQLSDYSHFAKAWSERYKKNEQSIKEAVAELPRAKLFMRSDEIPDQELIDFANKPWFTERVFDIYLWELGG